MSNDISFTAKNRLAPSGNGQHHTDSFLYREQDNILDFVFTNNGLGDLPLTHGNTIIINIPTDLLKTASKDQFGSASDWELTNDPSLVNNGAYPYIFTPKEGKTITLSNLGKITISLQKLQGGTAPTDHVSIAIDIAGEVPVGPSQKIFVFNAPQEGDKIITSDLLRPSVSVNNLQEPITSDILYISPTSNESISPPIANIVHLNLTFSGSALVKSWPANKIPKFIFSFSYANQTSTDEALTDAIKKNKPGYNSLTTAWNINSPTEDKKVIVDQTNLWEAQKLNQDTATPSWEVEATTANTTLFSATNRDLDVHFKHLISVLDGEDVAVYFQWENIPGYYPGVYILNLKKAEPKPSAYIFDFFGPDMKTTAEVPFGEPVILSWNSFAAAQVQLIDADSNTILFTTPVPAQPDTEPALFYCGGIIPSPTTSFNDCNDLSVYSLIPSEPINHYCLQALDADGNKLGGQSDVITINLTGLPKPVIEKFDVQLELVNGAYEVSFSWESKGADTGNIKAGDRDIALNNIDKGSIRNKVTADKPYLSFYTLVINNTKYNTEAALCRNLSFVPVKSIATLATPSMLTLSPDNTTVYVVYSDGTFMSWFSATNPPSNNTTKVPMDYFGITIAISKKNAEIYVTSMKTDFFGTGQVAIYSLADPPVCLSKTSQPPANNSCVSDVKNWLIFSSPLFYNIGAYNIPKPDYGAATLLYTGKTNSNFIISPDQTEVYWIYAIKNSLVALPLNASPPMIDKDLKMYMLGDNNNSVTGNFLICNNPFNNEIWVLSQSAKTWERIKLGTSLRQTFTYEQDISSFVIMPDGLHVFAALKGKKEIVQYKLGYK